MGTDLSDRRRRRLGKTISSYREAFFTEDRAYPGQQYRTYSPQDGADRRIREAISDICVSMKAEDYLTLPDYTEDIVPVVLDAKAKRPMTNWSGTCCCKWMRPQLRPNLPRC